MGPFGEQSWTQLSQHFTLPCLFHSRVIKTTLLLHHHCFNIYWHLVEFIFLNVHSLVLKDAFGFLVNSSFSPAFHDLSPWHLYMILYSSIQFDHYSLVSIPCIINSSDLSMSYIVFLLTLFSTYLFASQKWWPSLSRPSVKIAFIISWNISFSAVISLFYKVMSKGATV